MTAASPALNEKTAVCEGCCCSWYDACLVVGPEGSHGCSWDPEYWKAGRAVCTMCTGRVAPLERKARKA